MGWIKTWGFYLSFCVLLTGCSVFQEVRSVTKLGSYGDFELSGRVAVRVDGEGSSARIKWSHRGDVDAVDIYTPVGSIIAVILVSPRTGAVLETKDQVYEAPSVEALTERVLGWRLPLDSLKYWARGQVNPQVAIEKMSSKDTRQRLTYLEQEGWKVTFERYHEESMRPRVIRLEFQDLKIRFVLDEWVGLHS
ncbi:MAG: outer membrane lipoprotein LolB [Betaproteobacteria bacterium TMED22]|nr:MAG: outer membrane lipoprotein LolB [Betaproteobacteria bacterium TMED22]|tara:strand:- start:10275 stop:10853 length:579 start_codon:yes stop_codon:yes gene_type:complete